MFDKKILLYFSLAIVGFLFWTAWQKDYPKPQAEVSFNHIAAVPASAHQQQQATTISTQPVSSSQDRTIEVNTDTLAVKIDKLGGNIISLQLPDYPVAYETPNTPVTLLTENPSQYYAAQNNLVLNNDQNTQQLLFTSPQMHYRLAPDSKELSVVLTWKDKEKTIQKTYVFKPGKYDISVNYSLVNRSNTPLNVVMKTDITRRGISDGGNMLGLHTYSGAAISSPQTPYEKLSYSKLDKENLDRMIKGGWIAMQQRYFASAWVPPADETLRYYSKTQAIGETNKPVDRIYTVGFETPEVKIPAKGDQTFSTKLYSGPELKNNLQQVAPHLDLVIDYGWLWIFSDPIFKIMDLIYRFVHNWGLAIILVTVFIKLLFYKLSETSYRSMARMRNLQPNLLALKERYADDRAKLSQATMELYRKEKVNPLGGCLPMIIQIPVFIALYYVLIESVQLRQAPFIFWIHDLSVKDPYYVLPILMGLSWMVQQKLNPPPPDPVQAKIMMLFPVVFTILFVSFPAGLVLYWIVNNCLSILQQWYIMRKVENAGKRKPIKAPRVV